MTLVDRTGQVWRNGITNTICLIVRSEFERSPERDEARHQIVVLDGFAPRKFWFEDDGTGMWESSVSMTRLQ